MIVKGKVLSEDELKGFVSVEEFEGQVANIDLDVMKQASMFLDALKAMGFSEIEVGVENDGALLFFTNEERTTAFSIAPRVKKD
jgi:hypothetical protein